MNSQREKRSKKEKGPACYDSLTISNDNDNGKENFSHELQPARMGELREDNLAG